MALDYHDTFDRILAKAGVLAQKYVAVAKSRDEAMQRVRQLESELSKKEAELKLLRVEVEHLRTVSVLAPKDDQIEATRAIISGLVRDIDRCITDLEG